jgi:hypothetical protein
MRPCMYVQLEIINLKQTKSYMFPINFNWFRTEIVLEIGFVIITRKWFDVMVCDQQWLPTHGSWWWQQAVSLKHSTSTPSVCLFDFLSRFYNFLLLSLAPEPHKFKCYIVSAKFKYLNWHQCLMFKSPSIYIYISMHKPNNTYCWIKLNLSRKRNKNCHPFIVMKHEHSSMDMLCDSMLKWFQTCLFFK